MPERAVLVSLATVASPLLAVDPDKTVELLMASAFLPKTWWRSAHYVNDFQRLQPSGQQGQLGEIHFELAKNANTVTDIIVEVDLPAQTVTPAGSPVSYADWTGFAMIEHFKIFYSANHVYEQRPIDLYLETKKRLNLERLISMRQRVRGDQTTAQRTALFLNGTQDEPFLTPLYLPLADDYSDALPLLTLSQKVRFELKTRPLANWVTNPNGATYTPQGPYNINLLLNVVHTSAQEANKLLEMARSPGGITYLIHQNIHQNNDDFASAVPGFKISSRLAGITKPLQWLTWALIPTNLVNNTGTNDIFFFKANPQAPVPAGMNPYLPIQEWRIHANGLDIQRTVRRTYTTYYEYDMHDKGLSGEEVYTQNYSLNPHIPNAAYGYIDYSTLNNPILEITCGAQGTGVSTTNPTMPQSLRLLVIGRDYNFWYFKGGNWTKAFQ